MIITLFSNLQGFKHRLLKNIHLVRLLQILTVYTHTHTHTHTVHHMSTSSPSSHLSVPTTAALPFLCPRRSIIQYLSQHSRSTSTQQADGAEQPRLGVVHLQRQQLVGEGEHQVGERPEAGVVHLCAVQGQPVGEGHGVLVRRVAGADLQNLKRERNFSL